MLVACRLLEHNWSLPHGLEERESGKVGFVEVVTLKVPGGGPFLFDFLDTDNGRLTALDQHGGCQVSRNGGCRWPRGLREA